MLERLRAACSTLKASEFPNRNETSFRKEKIFMKLLQLENKYSYFYTYA